MPEDVTADTFSPQVGTEFRVRVGDETVMLRLAEVRCHPTQPGPRSAPFSLDFTGPPHPFLPQQTHTLEHQELGRLDIFLVPLGPGPDGAHRYEAVFN